VIRPDDRFEFLKKRVAAVGKSDQRFFKKSACLLRRAFGSTGFRVQMIYFRFDYLRHFSAAKI